MGIKLNSSNELTESQKVQADSMGIPRTEFKQQIINRLMELGSGKIPKTERRKEMKKDSIPAMNPVLVVAGGPSYQSNIKKIREFPNTVVVVDVTFNHLVQHSVRPDFVVTLESSTRIINPNTYTPSNLLPCRDKTTIIGSSITTDEIIEHIKYNGVKFERWFYEEEPRISNVGLFGIVYAYYKLHADKIILVGFEHTGSTYPPYTYLTWQTDFWHFIKKWPKETIVNCSNGGALYYEDYIIDTTLDKVLFI